MPLIGHVLKMPPMAKQKDTSEEKLKKKQFLTPVRVLLMTAMIFFLVYLTYRFFGVTDFEGWLDEVLMLIFAFVLVILAAVGTVALLMWVRKKTGNL